MVATLAFNELSNDIDPYNFVKMTNVYDDFCDVERYPIVI